MLMNEQQVQTLMEALPYLSNFKDKTIVVKYGGNAMLNDELKTRCCRISCSCNTPACVR